MKIIRSKDVTDIPAREVKPGMVIAEGIVLDVESSADVVFYTVPGRSIVSADYGTTVQVYAKLGELETDAVLASYPH